MPYRYFTILILSLLSMPLRAQFFTDFSEGNLDIWAGDKTNFIINTSQQLQLNAPSGSTRSWLYTPVVYKDSMVWDIYFKLDFAPSTSNQLRIFLGINAEDPTLATGYFLEVGATGDQDPIELKYRNAGTDVSVVSSAPGIAGSEPVEFRLHVTKNSHGVWECYDNKGIIPVFLFSAQHDLTPISSLSYVGFECKYTDTRRDKFYFDDISIQPLTADVTAPAWLDLVVQDDNSLALSFDESLEISSASGIANYTLQPGKLHPESVEVNQANVVLHFADDFLSLTNYTLHVSNLADHSGNVMASAQKSFTYVRIDDALENEILITEIMADPSPAVGLPEGEYLELFNSSTKTFNLGDYILVTGTSERSLPDSLFHASEYVILCDADVQTALDSFGRVVVVENFASLTNTGTTVRIQNRLDQVLNEVSYSSSWYADPEKSEGGWSLEMINPNAYCAAMSNWSASDHLSGGTPGNVNSIWNIATDEEGPELISLNATSENSITLRFDEALDPLLMENPGAYHIEPTVVIASAVLSDRQTLELSLGTTLDPGIVYSFLPFTAFDCLGNPASSTDTIFFGLSVDPDSGDILINEVLFNPVSGGSRFVEVINVSQKFISLEKMAIARLSAGQQNIFLIGVDENLAPGQLAAFSPDPADIDLRYEVPQPAFLYTSDLPSWDDEADNVTLLYNGEVLDSFSYSASWHQPALSDQNGVSLERISTLSSAGLSTNWTSAASTHGYATPTGENSQKLVPVVEGDEPFTVTNRQFSPDGDSFKDFLALNFLLPNGNQVATVVIYDLEGREITHLVSNETLGTNAIVTWDGRNDDQVLADMGIYVIFVQLWDADGHVNEYRETCALVKR